VNENDVIRFSGSTGENTAGTFSMELVGDNVGLLTEDIDALAVAPDGRLVISTTSNFSVPGVSAGRDEDLIALESDGLTWSLYLDGSDVSLGESADEDIAGSWIDPVTGDIYLTTVGAFDVPGIAGDQSDVIICAPTSVGSDSSCTFRPFFAGSLLGIPGVDVIGVSIQAR